MEDSQEIKIENNKIPENEIVGTKKRIDVMIDKDILREFRKICLDDEMTMSYRIEKLMEIDLNSKQENPLFTKQ